MWTFRKLRVGTCRSIFKSAPKRSRRYKLNRTSNGVFYDPVENYQCPIMVSGNAFKCRNESKRGHVQ